MVKFRRDQFGNTLKYEQMARNTSTTPHCFVLGSFGVMFMSCKVNFHVVRSVLHISMCILKKYDL